MSKLFLRNSVLVVTLAMTAWGSTGKVCADEPVPADQLRSMKLRQTPQLRLF